MSAEQVLAALSDAGQAQTHASEQADAAFVLSLFTEDVRALHEMARCSAGGALWTSAAHSPVNISRQAATVSLLCKFLPTTCRARHRHWHRSTDGMCMCCCLMNVCAVNLQRPRRGHAHGQRRPATAGSMGLCGPADHPRVPSESCAAVLDRQFTSCTEGEPDDCKIRSAPGVTVLCGLQVARILHAVSLEAFLHRITAALVRGGSRRSGTAEGADADAMEEDAEQPHLTDAADGSNAAQLCTNALQAFAVVLGTHGLANEPDMLRG
jgi:hypothetical protein